jgi:hypothetical protein
MSTYRRWARKILETYGLKALGHADIAKLVNILVNKYYYVEKVAKNKYVLRPRVEAVVPAVVKYVLSTSHKLNMDPIQFAYSESVTKYIQSLLPFSNEHEVKEIQRLVIAKVKEYLEQGASPR